VSEEEVREKETLEVGKRKWRFHFWVWNWNGEFRVTCDRFQSAYAR
jgi:hypothetical protein